MLLYNKKAYPNLTLDYFERGLISERFYSTIKRINRCRVKKYGGFMSRGNGMQTLYTFDDPEIVKVCLFISDHRDIYRYKNHKEKVFSSHINIFQPALRSYLNINRSYVTYQTIRPLITHKRMKLPLGKLRLLYFKTKKQKRV